MRWEGYSINFCSAFFNFLNYRWKCSSSSIFLSFSVLFLSFSVLFLSFSVLCLSLSFILSIPTCLSTYVSPRNFMYFFFINCSLSCLHSSHYFLPNIFLSLLFSLPLLSSSSFLSPFLSSPLPLSSSFSLPGTRSFHFSNRTSKPIGLVPLFLSPLLFFCFPSFLPISSPHLLFPLPSRELHNSLTIRIDFVWFDSEFDMIWYDMIWYDLIENLIYGI